MPVVSSPAPTAGQARFWRRRAERERRSSERAPLLLPPAAVDGHARRLGNGRSAVGRASLFVGRAASVLRIRSLRSGGLGRFASRLTARLRIGERPDPAKAADLKCLIDRDEEAGDPDEGQRPVPRPPDESLVETDDEEEEPVDTPPLRAPAQRCAESHLPAPQQCPANREQSQGRALVAEQKNKGAVFVIDAMDRSNFLTFLGASRAACKLVKVHRENGLHAESVKVDSIAGLCALLESIAGGRLNLLPNDDSPVLIVLLIHGSLICAGQNPGRLMLGYINDRILLATLLDLLRQDKLHSSFSGTSGASRLIHFAAIACRGLSDLSSASGLSEEERRYLQGSYGSEAPDTVRLLTPCRAGEVILVDPVAGTAILDAYGEVLNNRLHDSVESIWNASVTKVIQDPDRLHQRKAPGWPWVTGEDGVEMYRARPQRISTPTRIAWTPTRQSLAQPLVFE